MMLLMMLNGEKKRLSSLLPCKEPHGTPKTAGLVFGKWSKPTRCHAIRFYVVRLLPGSVKSSWSVTGRSFDTSAWLLLFDTSAGFPCTPLSPFLNTRVKHLVSGGLVGVFNPLEKYESTGPILPRYIRVVKQKTSETIT